MTWTSLTDQQKRGQLDAVPVDAARIARMTVTARRQLHDASVAGISSDTRFDCAYNAIRQIADMALLRAGFRTVASRTGHHKIAIACLEQTLGVGVTTIQTLDGLRRQRNGSNYDGEGVTEKALDECLEQANLLMQRFEADPS